MWRRQNCSALPEAISGCFGVQGTPVGLILLSFYLVTGLVELISETNAPAGNFNQLPAQHVTEPIRTCCTGCMRLVPTNDDYFACALWPRQPRANYWTASFVPQMRLIGSEKCLKS